MSWFCHGCLRSTFYSACAKAAVLKRLLLPFAVLSLIAVVGTLLTRPSSTLYEHRVERRYGEIIHEAHSDYSHMRVRQRDGLRNLMFVDAQGAEQRQSAIHLQRPHEMELAYTRSFFLSLLFRHPQDRVLIVGLGGGGMVRFLNHHFPETHVDAVEIDPEVVRVAERYFGTSTGPQTAIHTQDAFVYLEERHGPYDVIYMDAFLKPPADSNLETLTDRLKTANFLKGLDKQLKRRGIVAFNLIEGPATENDLAAIRLAFPTVHLFGVPKTRNLIAIAQMTENPLGKEALHDRAAELDETLDVGLSFSAMAQHLRE